MRDYKTTKGIVIAYISASRPKGTDRRSMRELKHAMCEARRYIQYLDERQRYLIRFIS